MDEIEITGIYSGNIEPKKGASWSRQWSGKETGFPSPAQDHLENKLSLDEYIIRRPAATFFVRVKGDGMTGAGIHSDDILVIDRSLKPAGGSIVIVMLDGEYKVKRIVKKKSSMYFTTDNNPGNLIEITDDLDYSIWGVVAFAIHQYV